MADLNIRKYIDNTFLIESECLKKAGKAIDEVQFKKAIDLLSASVRIGAIGCGNSGIACRHFVHLMCCIGLSAHYISPSEAAHGGMGFFKENDTMVFVSRGGKTQELNTVIKICKKKKMKVILITENIHSEIARQSDIVLYQYVNRETDKYNCQGTTSFTSSCVIFHAIQVTLMEKNSFDNKNFALIHPGGAVGEWLNNFSD